MYHPGDLTFKSLESSIVKRKDGKYEEVGTGRVCSNFTTWWRKMTGPFTILFDPEEHTDPTEVIDNAYKRFKGAKSLDSQFMFAEEAFQTFREAPEAAILSHGRLTALIEEMALHFLLYDDIAVHPVKLHCAQEAMKMVVRVKKGDV